MRKILLTILLFTALSIGFVGVSEAIDAMLWVDGAPGESTKGPAAGWIDVTSFAWGHSQTTTGHAGGKGGAGQVKFDTLSIEKPFDISSPLLAQIGARGQLVRQVILVITNPTTRQLIEKIELLDVIVASCTVEVPQGQALSALPKPTEKVSFRFARIIWEYVDPRGAEKKGWDVLRNIPF